MSALFVATLLATAAPMPAVAQEVHSFNVSAPDASTAIRSFGAQAGIQILASADDLRGKRLNQVTGDVSTEQGLNSLLAGTGLDHRYVGDRAVALVRSVSARSGGSGSRDGGVAADARTGAGGGGSRDPAAAAGERASAPAGDSPARTGRSDESTASKSQQIEEVIVTAQKRSQSLRDVPATVTVVDGAKLADFGVKDLFQLAVLLPGTTFSRAPDDGLQLTIHGLGTPARTQSFDQSVALFSDGAFMGKGRLYTSSFWDVDRIEVIKGTQSTLLGKNTSLGAISVVSVQPGTEFSGYVNAGYQFTNTGYTAEAGVTIPLTETLRLRVSGRSTDVDGWVHNARTGHDVPENKDDGIRVITLWQPSQSFDATLNLQWVSAEQVGNGYQFVDPNGLLPPSLGEGVLDGTKSSFMSQGKGGESDHRTNSRIFTLTTNTSLGEHKLTTVTGYASYALGMVDDFDFGNKDATYFVRGETYSQFSQEVRITSPEKQRFSYLAGLFYFNSDWKSAETQIYGTPVQVGPVPFLTIFDGGFTNDFRQKTDTISAFGSSTWRFTDAFRGNLGVRYTHESKDGSWQRPAIAPFVLWNQVINPPFAQTPLAFSDSFWNGNASLQYDLNDRATAYLSYGRGTKTGGFAESSAVSSADPRLPVTAGGSLVRSEVANSFESGVKGTALDRRLRYEVELFYTKVQDFQDTTFTGSSFDTSNVSVRSFGFESNASVKLSQSWRLDAAVAYADAKITTPPAEPPAGAPKWTGNVSLDFDREIGGWNKRVFGSLTYRYRSAMIHQRLENFASTPYDPVDLVAGLGSRDRSWEGRLSVRNAFNSVSANFSGPPADPTLDPSIRSDAPEPLRTVRLDLSYHF